MATSKRALTRDTSVYEDRRICACALIRHCRDVIIILIVTLRLNAEKGRVLNDVMPYSNSDSISHTTARERRCVHELLVARYYLYIMYLLHGFTLESDF